MKNYKSGRFVQQGDYRSFQPSLIQRTWRIDDMELIHLLGEADRALGRLDMFSAYVPNIALFIKMHVMKEATQSSRIEGTQTNMEEALLGKEYVPLEKRDDWEEVQNYVRAMEAGMTLLSSLPFSSRFLKETHRILLQSVRGKHKNPGEFRSTQNWIGGASIDDALFVPPVHTSVPELMGDLEKFAHDDQHHIPELFRIALMHYQFETIHPFLDGNGRVGRLMIPLYLVSRGILKQPVLYLSDFFEKNRALYYDNLMRVREKNDVSQWCKFFLVGVVETAGKGITVFDGILRLREEIEQKLRTIGPRIAKAQALLDALYRNPIIDAKGVCEAAGVSPASAYKLIAEFERLGILREMTGAKRSRLFLFDEYFRLFVS